MECKAIKDGLIDKTKYVHAGEVFEAAKCPSWAVSVKSTKKKTGGAGASPADSEDGE